MPKRRTLLLVTGLLGLAAASAHACPNHTATTAAVLTPPPSHAAVVAWKPRAWSPPALNASTTQGLRVAIDPVDGTLSMPTADQLNSDLVIQSDAPVSTLRRADGSVRAALDDRFAEYAVVTIGADGKPTWTCVHGTSGATQFMKHPVVPAAGAAAPSTPWEVK
jgi:hypothetical protein